MRKINSTCSAYWVAWNAGIGFWHAVTEFCAGHGKSESGKYGDRLKLGLFPLSLVGSFAFAATLPTGGVVVGGSGAISQSGNSTTITQSTSKMAIDWQSFSIGQGNSVNFVQPSASSVALNRVLGPDVSVIQGALTANGHVFLINPNGVLFSPTAQVNVGALVASTLSLSNSDFTAGNYTFDGTSSNAIVNQGNITAVNGGTIALIAAKITNDGMLTANAGNVLLGAGNKVTLDLGGPVKLQVEQGAIDALIRNGGAIKADGGLIYLTANAAGDLSSTVINNSGVIEAQTLATGEKGQIFLLGGMENDRIEIGGTLDASAPNGGDGGFIETSAANVQIRDGIKVSAASAYGNGGQWLIDPTDITISATNCTGANCIAGNIIASTLNGGTDVNIVTAAGGAENGDINVNADLAWNQNTLTLSAHKDIWIRGNLTGTGSAKLGLEYGQSAAGDSSNITAYTILGFLSLPTNGFSTKFGSNGTTSWKNVPVFLNNGLLRFGNGTVNSVDAYGSLLQPFYYNTTAKAWYKLTYADSSMYLNLGFGGTGYADGTIITNQTSNGGLWSGATNSAYDSLAYFLSPSQNISGFSNGQGTIVASNTVSRGGQVFTVENTYTLPANKQYMEATTKITNTGGSSVDNVRLWSGTRDDWIGTTDSPVKTKGNIVDGVFVPNTAAGQASSVIKVTSAAEGILFYSTSAGAETTIGSCCRPNFHLNTASGGAPLTSPRDTPYVTTPTDGNYSVYSNFGTLAASASKSIVWYYAAGDLASLNTVVASVSQAAAIAVGGGAPAVLTTPPPSETAVAAVAAVTTAQTVAATTARSSAPQYALSTTGPRPITDAFNASAGLQFVSLPGLPDSQEQRQQENSGDLRNAMPMTQGGIDPAGFMRVFVVGGGVRMPEDMLGTD